MFGVLRPFPALNGNGLLAFLRIELSAAAEIDSGAAPRLSARKRGDVVGALIARPVEKASSLDASYLKRAPRQEAAWP